MGIDVQNVQDANKIKEKVVELKSCKMYFIMYNESHFYHI